uniref:Uncharacterized protein n=1 Tax=Amphimedon queenslandica TaxID=400682 RepID=A0A1X7UF76_AMPQE
MAVRKAIQKVTNRIVIVDPNVSSEYGTSPVDVAYKSLTKIMNDHNIITKVHRKRYHETGTKKTERMEYERAVRVYNREMKKKIDFVMKMHKPLPPI